MQDLVFSPTDFVAVVNQTLEYSYPMVTIEGELANFRVSKNRWVYFNLKDEIASVQFFGAVSQLPGPLEDGLTIRAVGFPRLHPRFGFSVNFQSLAAVGEGSIKKAADLLKRKLDAEGLFAKERKRFLPTYPQTVGLITAANSAAASDFIKILNERWSGIKVLMVDVYVQGDLAPSQLVGAIEGLNQLNQLPEVLVVTRGGGSSEDLSAFNDERVVRAIAASRITTLVAIGHEKDESLAELAADVRASTPSNAVQILVPDKSIELSNLQETKRTLGKLLDNMCSYRLERLKEQHVYIQAKISTILSNYNGMLETNERLLQFFDPKAALRRGYALIKKNGRFIKSVKLVKKGDGLKLQLVDGKIHAVVSQVIINGKT